MNVELTSGGRPIPEENSARDDQQEIHSTLDLSNADGMIDYGSEANEPDAISDDQNGRHKSQLHPLVFTGGFALFTCIAATIGIIVVCLTAPKDTNGPCRLTFEQSAVRQNAYDSHPLQIAVGDFNHDGYLDMVVANSGTDSIGIFINNRNGTFAIQTRYLTGSESNPYSVAVGDFNNDTLLDIAVANYGINSIGVFLGYGNGSFADQIITSIGSSRPLSIAVGDFNNDTQLDIAVVNYGTSNVAVLSGFNNGSFRIDTIYDMGYDSIPYAIAIADLNQDNKLDIAIVNNGTSELAILLSDSNGSFILYKYSTGTNSHPCSVVISDLNKDNKLDIAVANSGTSNIGVFLGNGNGTFRNLRTYTTGSGSRPRSLAVIDLDSDYQLDIALVDSRYNQLIVLQGLGNNLFPIAMALSTGYNSNPSSIAVADVDNDNKSDIIISNYDTNNILVRALFGIYPEINPTNYSTGIDSGPYFLAVDDFNKDSYMDIVVPNYNTNNVVIFINLGNGTFSDQQTYDMPDDSGPLFLDTGDINNDTFPDIVVVLSNIDSICILLGSVNGAFTNGDTYSTGDKSSPYAVDIGDFNEDGNLDITVVNYGSANVGIFFGFGNGSFTDMVPISVGINYIPTWIGAADFNDDTILDIAVSSSANGGIVILLGYGNGSFQNPMLTSTNGDLPNSFTIGDLNYDLQPDIVYADSLYSHVVVLFGSGNGTFGSLLQYSTIRGSQPWSVALGYYNDDNLLDIAVSNMGGASISIFLGTRNKSSGISFLLQTGVGSAPYSIASADFNRDGQDDIVAASQGTNNIIVFVLYYAGSFANQASYTTGSGPHPYSINVADLNNDTKSDIIVANSASDNIQLLSDYNKGIFLTQTIFSTGQGSHPQSVTIADFNKDHLLDIGVVTNWDNNMNIFLGFGNGSFDIQTIYSTGSGSSPNSINSGDFNKDGRMDIVIANQGTDNVAVFLAFDYVTFTSGIVYVPGFLPTPYYVVTGDFNNDHLLDIAVANIDGNTHGISLGYGNGTFSSPRLFPTGSSSSPVALAVGNFNSDNYLDIVVVNSVANNIGIFLGYGNGSFQSQISYSTGNSSTPMSVAIDDLNNDGTADIVVANRASGNVLIFVGYGNGSFAEQIIYSMGVGSRPTWVSIGDINNDTALDILVANSNAGNVCILLGYGNGSFGNIITLSTGNNSGPRSIAIGDLNKDNLLDIVVANQISKNIGIFFGHGNGTFLSQKIYSTGSDSSLFSIVVRDMNSDTIPDIITTDFTVSNSSFAIFYGFGNGTFTVPKIYSTGSGSKPSSIAIGDFNNDSKIDLALNYRNQDSIGIMIQLGSEPFATATMYSTDINSHPKSVAIGDFNNDDNLDITVANSGTSTIGILIGYGDGYFSDQITYSTGIKSLPSSITTGYFNNDSYLDIAVVNSGSSNILIFLGYGNGTFTNIITYSAGIKSNPSSIAVADLNKDNHSDLAVSNLDAGNILVFYGIGNGSFLQPISYSLGYNTDPQSIAIGNINNDTMLDIVIANYAGNYVEVLLQTC